MVDLNADLVVVDVVWVLLVGDLVWKSPHVLIARRDCSLRSSDVAKREADRP